MTRRSAPWWVPLCAVPFVAYFALLVYCDLWRPESEGLRLAFGSALAVAQPDPSRPHEPPPVLPGSAAARAGLQPGDRILAVDGQPIVGTKMAWVAVMSNVEFGKPIALDIDRAGRRLRAELVFTNRESWRRWATREGIDLLVARVVQAITLVLGLLIVFRRPDHDVARLGGWLLASVGVFCVVPPYRIDAVWRSLWWPFGLALWLPLVSSLLLAALLLAFFLIFPVRRVRSDGALVVLSLPLVAAAAPLVRYRAATLYTPQTAPGLHDGFALLVGVSMAYLVATVGVVAWSYRRMADATERRRLRVLLAGAVVGAPAGGAIVLGWWRAEDLSLFGSASMGWLLPLLIVVPVSFAYAILRHRLFDVRLIIRRGVQYALARRLLLSLVPAFLLAMAGDLYLHHDQSMGEVVAGRGAVYLALSGAAVIAQFRRNPWLLALDRRFFRERYDAQRLLRQVAEDIRDAGDVERVAARVVGQIDLALHPRFVSLLFRAGGSDSFRPLAAWPPGAGPERVPADARVLALAGVLARPLEISSMETGWLKDQLPGEDSRLLEATGLELLVPIVGEPGAPSAFLALGGRRSEEPYAREDQDLLQAIAGTLGLLLSRDGTVRSGGLSFRECPTCGACFDEGQAVCAAEGSPLAVVGLPRVLVARYRLDVRLGRGGMGSVYSASDLALQRAVAVKVLREDLAGHLDAAERFEREARTVAAFSHPNVVTVHDFGITGRGRGFLVMELLRGRTLRAEMEQRGPLPAARVLEIMRGVCGAVDAAHRRQLVHRDLKPENVFLASVEGTEMAKVLDFGIAKALAPVAAGGRRATAVGLVVGTPEYMAPEQLRGEETSPSWDVWALGVIACEMLTGQHPFSAMAVRGTAPSLPAGHAALLHAALPAGEDGLVRFFSTALAIDPVRRFGSASLFFAALEGVL